MIVTTLIPTRSTRAPWAEIGAPSSAGSFGSGTKWLPFWKSRTSSGVAAIKTSPVQPGTPNGKGAGASIAMMVRIVEGFLATLA